MYMGLAACRPWPCGLRPCLRLACRRVAVPSFALALPRSRDCRLGMIRNRHRKAMPTTRIRVHPLSAFGLYRIDCPRARAAPGSAAPPESRPRGLCARRSRVVALDTGTAVPREGEHGGVHGGRRETHTTWMPHSIATSTRNLRDAPLPPSPVCS